ncbi:unnamed protein product [Adineta steineri]|uniref:Replication protein A OB domain-containing protein n=1 Tax=Adineta steineri TaxID=433720 RepID=A0A813MX10_9BILA|nr:unnamed protein product [Adineta steineri]
MASYTSSSSTSVEICDNIDNETSRNTKVSLDTIPKSIEQNKNEIDQNLQSNTEMCSNNIVLSRNMVTEYITQNINNNHQDTSTNNERVLINIVDINNNITFLWKIRAVVTCEYPKRTFVNTHGTGEISNWDLTDLSDVEGRVLRDFGISTGERNGNIWSRRDIHIDQDGSHLSMTLWNSQARSIDRNMVGLNIKFKNVKVSWYDGARNLITMANSQFSIV